MFQEDWVMRQIESIVDFLTVALLGKKAAETEIFDSQENSSSDADRLHRELIQLIRDRKINEAENLLFDRLNSKDKTYLALAVDFYSRLNRLDNDTLEQCDFSRAEIEDGLKEVAGRFGVPLPDLFQFSSGEEDR